MLISCAAWQAHAAVNCTTAGRFADTDDTTCQNYYLCVYISSTSSFTAYNYTCPTTSLFNPTTQVCTTDYECTSTNTTNTTDSSTSVCTEDGYVADSNSTDCSSYIQCVSINGTFEETTLTCPNTTYFNPNTTYCDSNYTCPATSDNSTSTTTDTCTTTGRIADTSDTTCQTYYLCVELSDGTLEQYTYTCPSTSVFNPNTGLCTTNYTCTTT
ncbi:chitin-binding domain protein cbd-1-like [Zerene cesonia]|uniref:chitin-binding domain protein cbd-1-like n=1 Tax=Zerene cesonia TaxID=33412 RepID=UPI0018E54BD3|nr:chitin-binding domain protein cbd-1-like [Zerene cesonia]